jgi:hypothetical protein
MSTLLSIDETALIMPTMPDSISGQGLMERD